VKSQARQGLEGIAKKARVVQTFIHAISPLIVRGRVPPEPFCSKGTETSCFFTFPNSNSRPPLSNVEVIPSVLKFWPLARPLLFVRVLVPSARLKEFMQLCHRKCSDAVFAGSIFLPYHFFWSLDSPKFYANLLGSLCFFIANVRHFFPIFRKLGMQGCSNVLDSRGTQQTMRSLLEAVFAVLQAR
jgi:hypothetical protein